EIAPGSGAGGRPRLKLLLAVVQSRDADACVDALVAAGHQCTRLASLGGFLDQGNTTLFTAVDDGEVEATLALLGSKARQRNQVLQALLPGSDAPGAALAPPMDVEVGGATVFVLDVARMERL
ncbi:MAG: hypothetical protein E6I55_01550, partial [Chloroflexi bacterium]